jgi:hypothetical protein
MVPEPGREQTSYRLEEEKARKAERAVAFFFTLTFVAGIAFINLLRRLARPRRQHRPGDTFKRRPGARR